MDSKRLTGFELTRTNRFLQKCVKKRYPLLHSADSYKYLDTYLENVFLGPYLSAFQHR